MMKQFIEYHENSLPLRISKNDDDLEEFLNTLNAQYPQAKAFISANGIRCITECATEMLVAMGLPTRIHRGAVLQHVERGGDPDQLIRPAAVLKFRRKSQWVLEKICLGNTFALQPLREGIKLTDYQKSILLRSEISRFVDSGCKL
jgi:hypothetical protein